MNNFAPIVIFSYNRKKKIKKLITSLLKNKESKNSNLYIFQDNYKNISDKYKIEEVKSYLKTIKGFKKIKIFYRKSNFGLTKNIICGIKLIFSRFNKAIFLEDDLIVSNQFLNFMNLCLNFYFKKKKIFHISGWNYNLRVKDNHDALIIRNANSWGWATWKDRWISYSKEPYKIINSWCPDRIAEFNLDNSYDFFSQIKRNYLGLLDTWAVFWYATIFKHQGLCVYPKKSLVKNIGFDKSATHTKNKNFIYDTNINSKKKEFILPNKICENRLFLNEVKSLLFKKKSLINKILYFLKLKNNNIKE